MDLRSTVKKVLSKKQDLPRVFPGVMGDGKGSLKGDDPNEVWVRIGSRACLARNTRVALQEELPVWVGYDSLQPNIFQVLGYRDTLETHNSEDVQTVPNHGVQHQFPERDMVNVSLQQFNPLRVWFEDAEPSLYIIIEQGLVNLSGTWTFIPETTKDLSSYVPHASSSEVFVLVTISTVGVITLTTGTTVARPAVLSDIPATPSGTAVVLAAVRLYTGQSQIVVARNTTDIVDLRFPGSGIAGLPPSHTHVFATDLTDVSIAGRLNNDLLVYNSSTGLWVPTADPTVDTIQFDLTHTGVAAEGQLQWNADDGTLEVGLPGSAGVIHQIGQELLIRAKNETGSTITNGSVVYVTGASGQRPTIALAIATTNAVANATIGLATQDIANGQNGYVTIFGLVHDLNTSSFTDGALLYLSATTAGALTTTAPTPPRTVVAVGVCLYAHATEGIIGVSLRFLGMLASRVIVSDAGGYFTSESVEGALQEIGAVLAEGVGGGGLSPYTWHLEGSLLSSTGVGMTVVIPDTGTIQKVLMNIETLGTSGTTTVDLHLDGTTIFTTQANRPSLAYNAAAHFVEAIPDVLSVTSGQRVTLDLDSVAVGAETLTVLLIIGSSSGGGGSTGGDVLMVQVFS